MKTLKELLITISIVTLLICSIMLVEKIYGEQHPNDSFIQDLNKFNFMITKEEYFVKTNRAVQKENLGNDFYNYTYQTVGYDKHGDGKKITYATNKKLKENHYLKITIKQGLVLSYTEVKINHIPKIVQKNLN